MFKVNNGISEKELIKSDGDKGIKVYSLLNYYLRKPEITVPQVVLGYGAMTEEIIIEATKLLKEECFS